jgi:uncharacterized membrane protein YdcZ (DUF606 family)
MSVSMILALIAVALGGVVTAIQAPPNGTLSRGLGHPVLAAAASFAVGLIAMATRAIFRNTWPSLSEACSLPWQSGAAACSARPTSGHRSGASGQSASRLWWQP